MSEEGETEYVDDELSEGQYDARNPTEEHDEPLLSRTGQGHCLHPTRGSVTGSKRQTVYSTPPQYTSRSTPKADVSTRPPLPIPKQSIMVVPISPSDGGEGGIDYVADAKKEDTRTMEQATGRPALAPPRRNELTPEYASRASGKIIQAREVMNDEKEIPTLAHRLARSALVDSAQRLVRYSYCVNKSP